jgi:hypothetical protein
MVKGGHTSATSKALKTALTRTSLRELQAATVYAAMSNAPSRFPMNFPHGIQAFDDGLDLLLVFSEGDFDATGTTFQLSDWLVHTPLEIVAQNLGLDISALQKIPTQDPYIFKSTVPPPQEGLADEQAKESPSGDVPNPYVFSLSSQEKGGRAGWVGQDPRFYEELQRLLGCHCLRIPRAKRSEGTPLAP